MNRKCSPIDFFVVAAARGGTTWLYFCLKDHPQICLSKKKEFVPFDRDGHISEEAIQAQFENCNKPNALRGVMPVSISPRQDGSLLVKKHFPGSKIIMFLRNPIERAYSQYKHHVAKGRLEGLTFSEVIRGAADVTRYGFYAHAVETYRRDMGADNVLIVLHEDIMRDHAGTLATVQEFLGVEQRESEYTNYFISVSREGRKAYNSYFLVKLHGFLMQISAKIKRAGGPSADHVLKRLRLGRVLEYISRINHKGSVDQGIEEDMEKSTILPEDRAFLKDFYAEDIAKLSTLLGKDLNWS